jgi:hypothetical protein
MSRSPRSRLDRLEQTQAEETRIRFLFVSARATDAEIAEECNRMIAAGEASATDRFIPFCWKDD